MSAFIVSDATISGMLLAATLERDRGGRYYYWDGEAHYFDGNWRKIGQKLLDENYRSVNYRYDEESKPHTYSPASLAPLMPVEILKLCNCYSYQTCETEDWRQTEAWEIMNTLRGFAIRALPGYEEAQWEL